TLALDPTLSAAQVAAMWQKVRSGVLRQGARGRTVSRKSLALALFVAHHPGRTWADLRRMWNQLYAHWAFKSPDLRVFRNAAVRARRCLLEPPELALASDAHTDILNEGHAPSVPPRRYGLSMDLRVRTVEASEIDAWTRC